MLAQLVAQHRWRISLAVQVDLGVKRLQTVLRLPQLIIKRNIILITDMERIGPLLPLQQYFMVSDEYVVPETDVLGALRKETFILDRVEHETPKELNARIEMERRQWGFTGDTLIVSDRDSAYSQAEMGAGVIVGTDLSIMSAGRTLKNYNCNIPETLIAVWRSGETRSIVAEYASALQRAFRATETGKRL